MLTKIDGFILECLKREPYWQTHTTSVAGLRSRKYIQNGSWIMLKISETDIRPYRFDDAAMDVDDGLNYILPLIIAPASPGRWVLDYTGLHNHDAAYAPIVHSHATLTRGTGLTGSDYDGSTARTFALDVGNANTWTGLQTFNRASGSPPLAITTAYTTGATVANLSVQYLNGFQSTAFGRYTVTNTWTGQPNIFHRTDSANTTTLRNLTIQRLTSHASYGGTNIGTGMVASLPDNVGTTENAGYLDCILTNAAHGSEESEWSLWTRTGGAAPAKTFSVAGTGQLTLPFYTTAGYLKNAVTTGVISSVASIPAADIAVDAAAFAGNLSATDTDVQTALETIDAMTSGGSTPEPGTITRDGDGLISSIALTSKTITVNRTSGYISSIDDGTTLWTFTRDANNRIASWTVGVAP